MKFYITEWHHENSQEGERRYFTVEREAVRYARQLDGGNDPWDWYRRPVTYRVTVKPTLRNVAALTAGYMKGTWEVVWDGDRDGRVP